jgi:hypothetical protein
VRVYAVIWLYSRRGKVHVLCNTTLRSLLYNRMKGARRLLSGTIIRGTLKTPNSQLVTPISIKLQRPDGYD